MVTRVAEPPARPPRPRDGHKGTFGTVLIVAGSDGMLGAAILAARGALRGGAGLVRAALPTELRARFTVAAPAATTVDRDSTSWSDALSTVDAVVCGPGLGTTGAARELLPAITAEGVAVVSVARARPTLDDVFLQLTGDGREAAA